MKDKNLWINIGISAGCYLLWLFVTFALISIDAIADYCLLLSAPLLIAGSAYVTYSSGKIIIYPIAASVTHIIVCITAFISVSADLDSAFTQSDDGFEALTDLFLIFGGIIVYAAIIAIGIIGFAAIFVISLLTGIITKKIIQKASS